jgi:hypothetical protein
MGLVQTSRAPDLLAIEKVIEAPAAAEGEMPDGAPPVIAAPPTFRARLGAIFAPIEKVGRRQGDPLDRVIISQADLKRLAKEAYRLGWSGKCAHVRELAAAMTQEIGE